MLRNQRFVLVSFGDDFPEKRAAIFAQRIREEGGHAKALSGAPKAQSRCKNASATATDVCRRAVKSALAMFTRATHVVISTAALSAWEEGQDEVGSWEAFLEYLWPLGVADLQALLSPVCFSAISDGEAVPSNGMGDPGANCVQGHSTAVENASMLSSSQFLHPPDCYRTLKEEPFTQNHQKANDESRCVVSQSGPLWVSASWLSDCLAQRRLLPLAMASRRLDTFQKGNSYCHNEEYFVADRLLRLLSSSRVSSSPAPRTPLLVREQMDEDKMPSATVSAMAGVSGEDKQERRSFESACTRLSRTSAMAANFLDQLRVKLASWNPDDVYNLDEYAIRFRGTFGSHGYRRQRRYAAQERLTVMACVNMTGSDVYGPEVVGEHLLGRTTSTPLRYTCSSKACLTASIFEDWIVRFDRRMQRCKRHVLLFVDNASSHRAAVSLRNTILCFLPPGMTSFLQPLDVGIIRFVRAAYRQQLQLYVGHLMGSLGTDEKTCQPHKALRGIRMTMALRFIKESWRRLKCTNIVARSFRRAGFEVPVVCSSMVRDENTDVIDCS